MTRVEIGLGSFLGGSFSALSGGKHGIFLGDDRHMQAGISECVCAKQSPKPVTAACSVHMGRCRVHQFRRRARAAPSAVDLKFLSL